MARKIQIGQDGRIRVKGGKIILARHLDPCCCQDEGSLYVRVRDCCNFNRVLWVLITMVGPCSVIQRTGPAGVLECWTLDTTQEPLTAAQIRSLFPDDSVDAPDTQEPYACGTCGVAPCPTCPECCMALLVPNGCDPWQCCTVGRKFRLRYDLTVTHHFRSIPSLFFSSTCGLVGTEAMVREERITFRAIGSFLVERVRVGNTCEPPTVICEGGSFVRRTHTVDEPSGPSTFDPTTCTVTTPPRVRTTDIDTTESECWGNPFDLTWFYFRPTGGNYFNTYGPAIANEECTPNPDGGVWPLSGTWLGTNNTADWTSSAYYTRTINHSCAGTTKNEDYEERYVWTALPDLPYTANVTQRSSTVIEVLDPNCGASPCTPGGGGGGALLVRGNAGTVLPVKAELERIGRTRRPAALSDGANTKGCAGCGGNAGVRAATAAEMARLMAMMRRGG